MLKVVIGHSEDVDSHDAIQEVLQQCKGELNGLIPQAGILYSSIGYDFSVLLEQITKKFPDIELIGGTTDGELTSLHGFTEDALSLTLFYSDTIEIKAGIGTNLAEAPKICAAKALQEAQSKLSKSPTLCLTFPEGLVSQKDIAMDELQRQLGKQVPVFGGATAKQIEYGETFQFYQTGIYKNSLPVLLFGGNIQFSHGIASGWKPIGKKGKITKVSDNEILEIDNQPALDFYRFYLGPLASETPEFPLAIFEEGNEQFYVRTVQKINEQKRSLLFSGAMPEGSCIQITEASREQLLEGAKESIIQAIDNFTGATPEVALVFSCAARKSILGTKTKEEFQLIQPCAENRFPIFGFYTYGEISPITATAPTRYHNGTFITLLLGSA